MQNWNIDGLSLRMEMLFGDRIVPCFDGRPNDINAMLRDAVAQAPDREALACGDDRLTWRDVAVLVDAVATTLHAHGIGVGDRVATLLGNRIEFVIVLLAVARLGAIIVPISTREQAPSIAYLLGHSGARLLIGEAVLADRLPARSDVPCIENVLLVPAREAGAPCHSLLSANAAVPPDVRIDEQDTLAILYTSGTTGRPKGAMVAHVNLVHAAMIYRHSMALDGGSRGVIAVPMTHVTGIAGLIAPTLLVAGTLIIMPEFKAPAFLDLAARERMTFTVMVPAMYNLLLARTDLDNYDLDDWRIGGYGGAPMPVPTIEAIERALPALGLMNLYGATEVVVPQVIMPPAFALSHAAYAGLVVPGGEVIVTDVDGREVPRGTPGELWIRSATVVRGYWNDLQASRDAIVGGFWRSGDLGQIEPNGFVAVLDRIKDMINRGGFKIYSAEVEGALREHAAVLESAVVGCPCPILGERVHAFVTLRTGHDASSEALDRHLRERLADYKCPEGFTIGYDPLPRNVNGKVKKPDLRNVLVNSVKS